MTTTSQFRYPPRLLFHVLRGIAWSISKALWFIRYRGVENIPAPEAGAFIIASNHQTYMDPAWICTPLSAAHKLRFMAWDEAFSWRYVGTAIARLGAFPVSLEVTGALKAMKEAIRALRDGAVLVVFPEGGREFADGELLPFKEGVVRLAMQARVPILPVTISGGNRVWPQGQQYPRIFRRITLTYHPLLVVDPGKDVDEHSLIDQLNQTLRETIASAL